MAERDSAREAIGRTAWAVALAGLSLVATPARSATGDAFLTEINRSRAQGGITCPAFTYIDGQIEPAAVMEAAPPLVRNPTLDTAAQAYAQAIADGSGLPQEEPRFLGPLGYLSWRAQSDYQGGTGTINEVAAAQARANAASNPRYSPGCRVAFASGYSEIGIGTAVNGAFTTFLFIVAEPFSPARIAEYARTFFDEINRIRAQGVTCPGGAQFGPMPAFVWSDGLAAAAQGHSEDMATWPYKGGDPHAGSNGSTAQARVAALPCATAGVWENVAYNSSTTPGLDWTKMTPGHCATVMSNQKNAGIGVSHAPPLASTGEGRAPFVTLDVATVTGACQPPDTPPVTPVVPSAYGSFDPTRVYRISNLGAATARPLDIYPEAETRSRRDEPTTALPLGNYSGQQWRLVAVPNSRYVTMSTSFRGDKQVLTINTIYPPLLLAPLYDQKIPTGIPKVFQYWLFEGVAGEANTYRIVNTASYGGRPFYLKAEGNGTVGYAPNPDPRDRSTYWKVEPYN
jgi:uncharacterized protein YkwD